MCVITAVELSLLKIQVTEKCFHSLKVEVLLISHCFSFTFLLHSFPSLCFSYYLYWIIMLFSLFDFCINHCDPCLYYLHFFCFVTLMCVIGWQAEFCLLLMPKHIFCSAALALACIVSSVKCVSQYTCEMQIPWISH